MENLIEQDIDSAISYMDGMCDNCGREIEDSDTCPYCNFFYDAEIEDDGVFYY